MNIIKNIEFKKIDNLKSKLIGAPSSGNLFDSDKKNSKKILTKNISKKIINDRNNNQNTSNESLQIHNENMQKSNNLKINDYLSNNLNKSKIVAKLSK